MARKQINQSKLNVPILESRTVDGKLEYLINCRNCGKEKWVRAAQYNRDERLFCSSACVKEFEQKNDPLLQKYTYRINNRYIEVKQVCEHCGEFYWVRYSYLLSRGSKFCGRTCSSRYYAETRNG